MINKPRGERDLFSEDYMDAVTHVRNISTCIRLSELVTIYRLDKPAVGEKLDQCIFKSLLKGRAVRDLDHVFLGLKWQKCDAIIKDTLFSQGKLDLNFLLSPFKEWKESVT